MKFSSNFCLLGPIGGYSTSIYFSVHILTFNFSFFEKEILSNKTKRMVGITQMEEAYIPQKVWDENDESLRPYLIWQVSFFFNILFFENLNLLFCVEFLFPFLFLVSIFLHVVSFYFLTIVCILFFQV
jgi:hypothetical protein